MSKVDADLRAAFRLQQLRRDALVPLGLSAVGGSANGGKFLYFKIKITETRVQQYRFNLLNREPWTMPGFTFRLFAIKPPMFKKIFHAENAMVAAHSAPPTNWVITTSIRGRRAVRSAERAAISVLKFTMNTLKSFYIIKQMSAQYISPAGANIRAAGRGKAAITARAIKKIADAGEWILDMG